ncbi:MAG TPA: DUF5335 family protein [Blastocatellia bacterium]|nr:DUF5335 family protein [Blastocatellia bacterium]HMV87509.1 DUF5335 family protein [Blastocatellia bacterium]HNG34374.1 DUF5335 family protein [Blastocatellia bacterium]
MSNEIKQSQWVTFFNEFSKRNHSRPTRIEVFGEMGAQEAEHHLPFNGISVDETGSSAPRVEILLGGVSPNDERHLTHVVTRASNVFPKTGASGQDEALEIVDADGGKTLLSFVPAP